MHQILQWTFLKNNPSIEMEGFPKFKTDYPLIFSAL